jgi:hypothetical protein
MLQSCQNSYGVENPEPWYGSDTGFQYNRYFARVDRKNQFSNRNALAARASDLNLAENKNQKKDDGNE